MQKKKKKKNFTKFYGFQETSLFSKKLRTSKSCNPIKFKYFAHAFNLKMSAQISVWIFFILFTS